MALMRGEIRDQIAETYPEFSQSWSQSLKSEGHPAEAAAKIGQTLHS
jgi:hypothetical protein